MKLEVQLKKYRRLAGLNQQQMADALKIKKRTYGSWERGEANMSLPQACECADILCITLDELAGRKVSDSRNYTDPRQEQLNGCYESLNDESKTQVSDMVKSIAADPSRRVEKVRGENMADPADMEGVA